MSSRLFPNLKALLLRSGKQEVAVEHETGEGPRTDESAEPKRSKGVDPALTPNASAPPPGSPFDMGSGRRGWYAVETEAYRS